MSPLEGGWARSNGALGATAGLAEARWALSSPAARRILRRELGRRLQEGWALGTCRLRRAKLKPGRKLSAYYDVSLRNDDEASPGIRAVAVTWERVDGSRPRATSDEAAATEAEAIRRGVAAPFSSLRGEVPEWGMRIEVWPLDECFPQLVRLSDPSHAASVVPGADGALPSVTTVRYRPRQRQVLRFSFHTRPGAHPDVFAKLYADDLGRRAFALTRHAALRLADAGHGLRAVTPIAYLEEDEAFLSSAVGGSPLSRGIGRSTASGTLLWRAGVMLRALHEAPSAAPRAERYDLAAELRATRRACEHIDALLPEVGARARSVLRRAAGLYHEIPGEPPTLVHRDFKLDHLFVQRGGLTLIDFDSCSISDPALDVGKLLADLAWWDLALVRRWDPDEARRRFLEGYAPAGAPERLARARTWEAVWLVKAAARRVPIFDPAWAARVTELVERAEELVSPWRGRP